MALLGLGAELEWDIYYEKMNGGFRIVVRP